MANCWCQWGGIVLYIIGVGGRTNAPSLVSVGEIVNGIMPIVGVCGNNYAPLLVSVGGIVLYIVGGQWEEQSPKGQTKTSKGPHLAPSPQFGDHWSRNHLYLQDHLS